MTDSEAKLSASESDFSPNKWALRVYCSKAKTEMDSRINTTNSFTYTVIRNHLMSIAVEDGIRKPKREI